MMDEGLKSIVSYSPTITNSVNWEQLAKHTRKVPLDYLRERLLHPFRWNKLRYLYILDCNKYYELRTIPAKSRPQIGCWIDGRNEWLLVIGLSQQAITECISHCTQQLEHLSIYFTTLHSLDVGHLTGLKTLDLPRNKQLTQLNQLEQLHLLENLDLSNTSVGPELNLNGNTSLKSLHIGNTKISKIRLSTSLPNLRTIAAWNCPICSSDFLQYLPELIALDVSYTAISDLDFLKYCPKLEQLNANYSKLTHLPTLDAHKALHQISLSRTPIDNLDNVAFPHNLHFLNLDRASIQRIPAGLRNISELQYLYLNGLKLDTLPGWLSEWLEENKQLYVFLAETHVEGIDSSTFSQPWSIIREWLIERKQAENKPEGKPLNELKVVFLGDGGAGKSYTIARLLADGKQPKDFSGDSTPGIVITDKQYRIGERDVQIHFWDFGGQEILHSMHRMFLTDRTLYVVMLNVRDGTQDERARYWLHNIKSFAPKAPVLLVLNQMDENPNASINEKDLGSMAPGLTETVKMSALKFTPEDFNATFTAALLRQIGKMSETLDFFFPAAWTRVKQSLRTMKDHYIHGDAYNTICQDCGVSNEGDLRKGLLRWFNDLGVSFCYGDARLEDYVILRPDWLTNAIYILLFNRLANVKNGIVPLDTIYRILRLESGGQETVRSVLPGVTYNRDEVSYVLDVVRKFRLSFPVNGDEEFIPMLCDRNSLDIAAEYENDPATLEFRMEYEYLPNNVLHRLMVELRGHLDTEHVWLTGARFAQRSTGLSAVVKTEGNVLKIFGRSTRPLHKANTYLNFIKDALDQINRDMGLVKPDNLVIYKSAGISEEFDYDDLLNALEDGETTYRSPRLRKKIPIEDILNQSAPIADEAQEKLIRDIVQACAAMQSQKHFWNLPDDERSSKEDIRNDCIRNFLRAKDYIVSDQTRSGVAAGGRRAGELDMDIRLKSDDPWTIYEALNIAGTADKSKWDAHLHKLLINYNPNGLPFLFLVSYLECSREDFSRIADTYDDHMRWHDPKDCGRVPDSFAKLDRGHEQFIRVSKCMYYAGVHTTVYHICVRLGS